MSHLKLLAGEKPDPCQECHSAGSACRNSLFYLCQCQCHGEKTISTGGILTKDTLFRAILRECRIGSVRLAWTDSRGCADPLCRHD